MEQLQVAAAAVVLPGQQQTSQRQHSGVESASAVVAVVLVLVLRVVAAVQAILVAAAAAGIEPGSEPGAAAMPATAAAVARLVAVAAAVALQHNDHALLAPWFGKQVHLVVLLQVQPLLLLLVPPHALALALSKLAAVPHPIQQQGHQVMHCC